MVKYERSDLEGVKLEVQEEEKKNPGSVEA